MFKNLFCKFQLFPTKKNGLEQLDLPLEIEKIIFDYKNQLETYPSYEEFFKKSLFIPIKQDNHYVKPSEEYYSTYTNYSIIH